MPAVEKPEGVREMEFSFQGSIHVHKDEQQGGHFVWIQRVSWGWHEPWLSVCEGTEALPQLEAVDIQSRNQCIQFYSLCST